MILKRHFSPASMWPYARFELTLGVAASAAAWVLYDRARWSAWALPPAVATVLGTALSILLAVRANTAYQRWWEASGIWAQLLGLSRTLVRVAVTVSNAKPGADIGAVRAFQTDIARRQAAYLTALRVRLRGAGHDDLERRLAALAEPERTAVSASDNPPLALAAGQSARIFAAYGEGILSGLDNFQMETALAGMSVQQALAERISMQPVPRTYDVFSRYLVHLYTVAFPFAIIATVSAHRWIVVVATALIAFAFRMIERIGSVVEAPFGNTVQDVPLTAIDDTAARDLFALAGIDDRPAAPAPVGGYLW